MSIGSFLKKKTERHHPQKATWSIIPVTKCLKAPWSSTFPPPFAALGTSVHLGEIPRWVYCQGANVKLMS